MSILLRKQDILSSDDIQTEDVEVPEWGGRVRVKAMSGEEKDSFEASLVITRQKGNTITRLPNNQNVRAKLVARSIVDESGELIFSEEDVVRLGRKSAMALDRVVEVASRLSRLKEADIKELSESLKNDPPAASPID